MSDIQITDRFQPFKRLLLLMRTVKPDLVVGDTDGRAGKGDPDLLGEFTLVNKRPELEVTDPHPRLSQLLPFFKDLWVETQGGIVEIHTHVNLEYNDDSDSVPNAIQFTVYGRENLASIIAMGDTIRREYSEIDISVILVSEIVKTVRLWTRYEQD